MRFTASGNVCKLALSAIAFVFSLCLFIGYESEPGIAYDDSDTENFFSFELDLITNAYLTTGEPAEQTVTKIMRQMTENFAGQLAINEDTAGWLLIPNVCYYPIMYSSIHDYYLTHDQYNSYSAQGAIFINYQCEPNFDGMLTLVHGHSMKNATMFGQLKEYLGNDFFKKNGLIMIYDGKVIRKYKPFTAVILEENNDVIVASELSEADRISYIKSMYNRSVCKMEQGEEPDLTKPAVFFSTCDYSFNQARLLVGAYLTEVTEVY